MITVQAEVGLISSTGKPRAPTAGLKDGIVATGANTSGWCCAQHITPGLSSTGSSGEAAVHEASLVDVLSDQSRSVSGSGFTCHTDETGWGLAFSRGLTEASLHTALCCRPLRAQPQQSLQMVQQQQQHHHHNRQPKQSQLFANIWSPQ